MAEKMQGVTGENLLRLLESRLDNVVYRLGMASSRAEARQLVDHGHFTVNGRKVNIPSFLTRPGQVVAMKDGSRSLDKMKAIVEAGPSRSGWSSTVRLWKRKSSRCPTARTSISPSKKPSSSSCTRSKNHRPAAGFRRPGGPVLTDIQPRTWGRSLVSVPPIRFL